MKSGFQSDFPVDNEEIQRADQNIPLNKFGLGAAKWQEIKKKLELPDQYLRTCTLREGTIVTMIFFQTMSLTVTVYLCVLLFFYDERTNKWWKEKFRNDFDYYYQDENEQMIKDYTWYWRPFTKAVIGAHAIYFLSGFSVIFALVVKNALPIWYLPWIIVTILLNIVHWSVCGLLIIAVIILAFYRDISVTWDLVPICCAIAYGVGWTYSCAVVIAQYKRRCIVRYWRDRQDILGTDSQSPEITDYLYQYGKGK